MTNGAVTDAKASSFVTENSPPTHKKKASKIGKVLISGVGFLADAYDLFVIDFVIAILAATSFVPPTNGEKGAVASATLAGAVVGQLGFGIGADFIGRRIMFIATASLVTLGSLVSAVVGWGYNTKVLSFSIFSQLALVRFFLGVGIGGEYPLAATVATETESSEELERAARAAKNGETIEVESDGCWYLTHKPNSIAAVFSMQGIGMLLSPLIVMFCISVGMSLEATWRLCLGLGAVPSAIAFIFRWRMHETAAFSKAQVGASFASTKQSLSGDESCTPEFTEKSDGAKAEISISADGVLPQSQNGKSCADFGRHLKRTWGIIKQFKWILLGTSSTWFLIDVTLYGTGSFKSEVVGQWFQPETNPDLDSAISSNYDWSLANLTLAEDLRRPIEFPNSVANLQRKTLHRVLESYSFALNTVSESEVILPKIDVQPADVRPVLNESYEREKIILQAQMASIVACMAIPGYFLSLFLIHKTGTRPLTFWGFIAVAIVFILLGGEQMTSWDIPPLELILFGLTFLFSNFGPNATTFIAPTQLYPTVVRATCHGFSAAMGKLGGVVGTSLFSVIQEHWGLGWLLIICGLVAFVGAGFTMFIPTDAKGKEFLETKEIELSTKAKYRAQM